MIDITRKFSESLDLEGNEAQFLAEAVWLYQNSPLSQTPKTHRDRFPDRFDDVVYNLIKDKESWANEGVTYDAQRLILRDFMDYLEATAVNPVPPEEYFSSESVKIRLGIDKQTILARRAQWQKENYSQIPPITDIPSEQAEQYL